MESFKELALPAFLHESLNKMKFDKPTPVQAQAIPPALEGRDIIASAETGSGKTAAFGIPLLNFLAAHSNQSALILTPTRELADQVSGVLTQLSGGRHDLRSALLIGGVAMGGQLDALRRGARLIIGTPGRINDHLEQRSLNLSRTGFLVLDEADRMLDMGFAPQLDRIRRWLTAPRQTVLFSATIPPDIQKMASLYLKDPVRITVGSNSKPVERIAQKVLHTSQGRKFDELVEELRIRTGSVLIFVRTKHKVDRLARQLKDKNFECARIHGDRSQGQRRAALEQFKEGGARIMVATDIAARGLDIVHIAHVINFDLPQVPEDYVHRIGRTARAGAEGDSLSLLTPEDAELWRDVQKTLGAGKDAVLVIPSHFKDHASSPQPSSHSPGQRHQPQGGRGGRNQGRPQGSHSGSPHRSGPTSHGHGPSSGGGRHEGRPQGSHSGPPHRSGSSTQPSSHGTAYRGSNPNSIGASHLRSNTPISPGSIHPRSSGSGPRPSSGDSGHRRDHNAPHSPSGDRNRRHEGDRSRPGQDRDHRGGDRHRSGHGPDNSAGSKVKKWFKKLF